MAATVTEEDKETLPPNSTQITVAVSKVAEAFKPEENSIYSTANIVEKPTFLPPKPISHSPKISPSSIPNPNPSVTTTKQVEPGYSNYGGFMYSVPGYSAFQPVSYPGIVQPTTVTLSQKENPTTDFNAFPIPPKDNQNTLEDKPPEIQLTENISSTCIATPQTDFEEHFVSEVVPPVTKPSVDTNNVTIYEPKSSTTSLTQSNAVSIPSQITNKEIKKKTPERFSLKTSIPISKIDIKCVNHATDTLFQNSLTKKPFNPAFHTPIKESASKVEIKSNIVIKSALKEPEVTELPMAVSHNSITTLLNAAEAINKSEVEFLKSESKSETANDIRDSSFSVPASSVSHRPIFNPMNIESSKLNFQTKTTDSSFVEQKNQIVLIQNKNPSNQKMLLTIQQQNPQVILQRTGFDSKNLQTPSRPSSQTKKCKEELVNENGTSSKVVSLKRLHQENCDENDFENLITENQIYGNKIVVKEKLQGTSQEQGLKNKNKTEKLNQVEQKNVVLQPNFLYLSNVQFPANLMMIKNNTKITSDNSKGRIIPNDKQNDCSPNANDNSLRNSKPQNIIPNKEIHVLKSNNSVLQSFSNKNTKQDLVFQTTNQKVIMNSQIVYQVPMVVESDNKHNSSFVNRDFSKIVTPSKTEFQKPFEQNKNDKLFIACPYQMDAKLQPKIVITNIRSKITKIEEISSLDIYEKRKRLRRLKYLSNREIKSTDLQKTEIKVKDRSQDNYRNIITPDKMKAEVYKELSRAKVKIDYESSDNDSEYGEDEIEEYKSIISEYSDSKLNQELQENSDKAEFLSIFKLATQDEYREKIFDRQERIFRRDAVASAYIAAGRLDCLVTEGPIKETKKKHHFKYKERKIVLDENTSSQRLKQTFLSSFSLTQVTKQCKEEYEAIWQEIIKERKRRGNPIEPGSILKLPKLQKITEMDTNGQLQILIEIKKHVSDNNKLIKKRLDSFCANGESIKVLAEKNFTELSRLSIMADRSVKHFSGQDTKKRDLNPGFDSENIQSTSTYYPNINIPNVSKIIALKSEKTTCTVLTTPATSMDEPQNCAAGVNHVVSDLQRLQDFSCQVNETLPWPGVEAMVKIYKEHDLARKKEMADLHKRNTQLRVESAHVTRAASRDSDRARALLAERRNLANEERAVRSSIQWLCSVVDIVRNYEEKNC